MSTKETMQAIEKKIASFKAIPETFDFKTDIQPFNIYVKCIRKSGNSVVLRYKNIKDNLYKLVSKDKLKAAKRLFVRMELESWG